MRDVGPILCTGQMRAGTTWLYESLKSAGNVWCPPVKELRILSALEDVGVTTCLERYSASGRGTAVGGNLDWWKTVTWRPYLEAMVGQVQTWLETDFQPAGALELEFWANYIGRPHSLDLYQDLARLVAPYRILDVTPEYVGLSSHLLKELRTRFDRPLFVVMLREPEERLCSQIRRDFIAGQLSATSSEAEQLAYFEVLLANRWNYMQINVDLHLNRLAEVFGEDSVFIIFMEDIRSNPAEVCARLAMFCETHISVPAPAPVNTGTERNLSTVLHQAVRDAVLEPTQRLAELLGAPAASWLRTGRTDLSRASAVFASGQMDRITRR